MFPVFHREHARVLFKGTGKVLVGCITHQFRYVQMCIRDRYETVLKRMYPDRVMSAYIAYVIKEGRLLICMGAILLAESIAPYVVRFHPIRTGKHVVQVMPGEALVVLITWDQPLLHQPYIHLIYHPGSTWKIRLCPGGPVNHNRSDPVASVVLGLGIADVVNRSPELLCDRAFLPVRRQAWLQAQAGDFGFEAKDVLEQGLGQPGSGCAPPGLSRRSQTVACLLCKIGVAHNVGLTVFFMVFMVEGKDLLKTHLYLLVVLLHTVHSQLPAAGMEVNAPVFMDACGFLGHLANGIHIAVVGGPGYQLSLIHISASLLSSMA